MFEQLLSGFLSSSHGNEAASALASHGLSQDQASSLLGQALPAAASALQSSSATPDQGGGLLGMLGGSGGAGALAGALGGLLGGQGVQGAIENAGAVLVATKIADVIAEHQGWDKAKCEAAAAVVAPFIVRYAHEKLASKE